MPIGTTADFTVTRNDLIELALSILGVTEPTNDEYSLASKVLNSLVRNLDAQGTWLWGISNTESSLTLVAGQSEYVTGALATNIATDILKLEWAAVLKGTERHELTIFDKKSSLRTHLKSESNGEPVAVYLHRASLRSSHKMIFYPTPNAADTVKYHYRKPLFEFDTAADNPDFPQDWFLPLQKILAKELAPHFGKPLTERQLLDVEAERAFQKVEAFQADNPSYETLETEYF